MCIFQAPENYNPDKHSLFKGKERMDKVHTLDDSSLLSLQELSNAINAMQKELEKSLYRLEIKD